MFFCSNSEQQQQNKNVKKTSLVYPDTEYCISLTNWQLTICCLLRFVLFSQITLLVVKVQLTLGLESSVEETQKEDGGPGRLVYTNSTTKVLRLCFFFQIYKKGKVQWLIK